MKYRNQKTATGLQASKHCFFFKQDVELAWNSKWEFAFISPYIQTLTNSMLKSLISPQEFNCFALNCPPGTEHRQGLHQEGTHQEKLPEWQRLRTKTILFKRYATLKKTPNLITLLSKESIFSVLKSTGLRKTWYFIHPLNKSYPLNTNNKTRS